MLFTITEEAQTYLQAVAGLYQFFIGHQVNVQSVDVGHLLNFLHNKGAIGLNNVYHGNWNDYIDINNKNWKYYVLDI